MRNVELRINEEYKYKIVRQINIMIAGYKKLGKEFLETWKNINLSIDEIRVILRYIFFSHIELIN